MNSLHLIGRDTPLLDADVAKSEAILNPLITASRFLVIGGAGAIGQAVCAEIFKRNPAALHVVDISENNLVELVRSLRSTFGYGTGDFKTYAIDCGGIEFDALLRMEDNYDYVLNLSALKHVRSERDPFTLMRLIQVNILNTISSIQHAKAMGTKKYFCVSTDKATNPVNMMGASKRIMELFLLKESEHIPISTARFANVAFSDGSLLHGFTQRIAKKQPLSAPHDVERYFVSQKEAGELCLLSCLLGENRDIFFPKLSEALNLIRFSDIAERYLRGLGFEPHRCSDEDEARRRAAELIKTGKWPVYFFASDTSGEKDFEEFFVEGDSLDLERFESIGVVRNNSTVTNEQLDVFLDKLYQIQKEFFWDKKRLVDLFHQLVPEFKHKETGKNLDNRM